MMAARAVATLAAASAVVLAVLLAGTGGASAQSSCTTVLVSLSPCLNYISGNTSTVSASCCSQLGNVVQSNPQCLCVALSADPASLGLTVNRTRALGLPDACNVKTPDISNCKGSGAAGGAPVTSPAAGSTPTTTTTPATGSKTTPAATSSVPGAAATAASPRGVVAGFVAAATLVVAGFAV